MVKRGLTDRLVEILVPHVVDSAACAAHHEGAETKQSEVCERGREWGLVRVRGHGDGPG